MQILGYQLNLSHYFTLPHLFKLIIGCLPYEMVAQNVKRLCVYCTTNILIDYKILGFTTWYELSKVADTKERNIVLK